MTEIIVFLFLAFFLLDWAVETGLATINLLNALTGKGELPPPLKERVAPETVRKSRDYTVAKLRFGIVRGASGGVLVLAVLFSGVLPWVDGLLVEMGLAGAHLFVAYLLSLAAASGLAGLPFALYGTFGIETRFGFNRMTAAMWLRDRAKGLAVTAALAIPFLYGVYYFIEGTGVWWWVWLFAFITAAQMLLVWLYPALIAPLFNTFTPLGAGELKERVEAMAREAGFRIRGIFMMDASRRSGHSNAYFTGLLRPRIVLFDTLLEEMTVEQSLAVLAHEIGHYRMRHILKGLAASLAGMLGMLWVLSLLVVWEPFFHAFGFAEPSTRAAVVLAMLTGGSFTFYLGPLFAWLSRRREYEADAYSVRLLKLPEALKAALIHLNGQNLADLTPHPWYSAYHYSHPTLLQRLAAIDRLAAA